MVTFWNLLLQKVVEIEILMTVKAKLTYCMEIKNINVIEAYRSPC